MAGAGEHVRAPSHRYLWIDDDIWQLCGMRESIVAIEPLRCRFFEFFADKSFTDSISLREARVRHVISSVIERETSKMGTRRLRDKEKALCLGTISRNCSRCFENWITVGRNEVKCIIF